MLRTVSLVLGFVCVACASTRSSIDQEVLPPWVNSVLTVRETAQMSPAMGMAERLDVVRQAKQSAYARLRSSLFELTLDEETTIGAAVADDPERHDRVESYVRRMTEIRTTWSEQQRVDVEASITVGVELIELLQVATAAAPDHRQVPSTGIVHSVMEE